MPSKSPLKQRSPTKNDLRDQKIRNLEEKMNNIEKRNENMGKNMQDFVDKQEENSKAVLPLQKLFGFGIAGLLLFLGIAVLVYSAVRVSDTNIRDHLYIYGSLLILLSLVLGICIHFYVKYMSQNFYVGGKVINVLGMDTPGLKTLLKA